MIEDNWACYCCEMCQETEQERIDHPETDNFNESWSLRILSAHTILAQVDIEGDKSSGYYCHSVTLRVKGESA